MQLNSLNIRSEVWKQSQSCNFHDINLFSLMFSWPVSDFSFIRMGKKNKKISSSVELRRKRKSHAVSLVKKNPFEVRLNRLKHNVIGKKVKTDKGLPGVSRSKANEKVYELFISL